MLWKASMSASSWKTSPVLSPLQYLRRNTSKISYQGDRTSTTRCTSNLQKRLVRLLEMNQVILQSSAVHFSWLLTTGWFSCTAPTQQCQRQDTLRWSLTISLFDHSFWEPGGVSMVDIGTETQTTQQMKQNETKWNNMNRIETRNHSRP